MRHMGCRENNIQVNEETPSPGNVLCECLHNVSTGSNKTKGTGLTPPRSGPTTLSKWLVSERLG